MTDWGKTRRQTQKLYTWRVEATRTAAAGDLGVRNRAVERL